MLMICVLLAIFQLLGVKSSSEELEHPKNIRYTYVNNGLELQWDHPRASEDKIEFTVMYQKYIDPEIVVSDTDRRMFSTITTPTNMAFLGNVELGRTYQIQIQTVLKHTDSGTKTVSSWSPILLIQIKSSDQSALPKALKPPKNFRAFVSTQNSLSLSWQPGDEEQEPVEQKRGRNADRPPQEIKIKAHQFLLNELEPGAKYQLSIKAASESGDFSTARTVMVELPTETQYFSINDLTMRTNPAAKPGTVNLTWHVPERAKSYIRSYKLMYSIENSEEWTEKLILNSEPWTVLVGLENDKVYLIQILTNLRSGIVMESKTFQFMTPPVEPILKVDVIYSREIDSVRLEWLLQPHVSEKDIAGYAVLLTKDKTKPENEWLRINVEGLEKALSVNDLEPATTYFAKIAVRKTDGALLKGMAVYRFQTLDQHRAEMLQPIALTYRNLRTDPGKDAMVKIRWTLPRHIKKSNLSGILVMYSADKNLPEQDWMKILVADVSRTSLTLTGLQPNTQYFVRVLPRYKNGKYINSSGSFRIHTSREGSETGADRTETDLPTRHDEGEKTEESSVRSLCLRSCKPRSTGLRHLCASTETCVPVTSGATSGWCIPNDIVQSAKRLP